MHPDAYSLVDVAAPSALGRVTRFTEELVDDPDHPTTGYVEEFDYQHDPRDHGIARGSRLATPIVSGSALLVKDYLLSAGHSWVNYPGRLHVIMLSMADRWHHYSGDHEKHGTDNYSGVGRFKLQPLKPGPDEAMRRWSMRTFAFSSSTEHQTWNPYDSPLPHDTEFVKCTTNIPQDHRSSTDLSNVDLAVVVREPVDGECVEGQGLVVAAREDVSYGTKKMAAISSHDESHTLEGNCLEYRLLNRHVPDDEIQMVNNFCSVGTRQDYEPFR